jgi:hypothetical protein
MGDPGCAAPKGVPPHTIDLLQHTSGGGKVITGTDPQQMPIRACWPEQP